MISYNKISKTMNKNIKSFKGLPKDISCHDDSKAIKNILSIYRTVILGSFLFIYRSLYKNFMKGNGYWS